MTAHQILRHQREHNHHREDEQVFFHRRIDPPAEQLQRRSRDRARRRVVGKPLDARKHPVDEKLRRQGRHAEVQALDLQRRQAEQNPHQRRDHPGQHQHQHKIEHRKAHRDVVGGIGANRHEGGVPERNLAAVADQNVQANRRQSDDQERNQDRAEHVVRREIRHRPSRKYNQAEDEPAVLADAQNLLVSGVRRFELAVFAVEHGGLCLVSDSGCCG